MISLDEFLGLPQAEIAQQVRAAGPQVCVLPINGTRRWFALENTQGYRQGGLESYMDQASRNHVELFRLFYDHGVDTLIVPEFGPELILRGDEYVKKIGAAGLERLAKHPVFRDFYSKYDVRVHFYGDYKRKLSGTPYEYLADLFAGASEETREHHRFRLFYGAFANDAAEIAARFSVQYYLKYGKVPDKRDLVEEVYGEYVEPATLFIGFDKPCVFDYPLLSSGEEDLYFTLAPTPYLEADLLRRILYDHLYTRRIPEPDYDSIEEDEVHWIKEFYKANHGRAMGIGFIRGGLWFPEMDAGETMEKESPAW